MKRRSRFISNSSSSSFVVLVKEFFFKKSKGLLTPKEEKLLINYGFKKVNCCHAHQVDCDLYHDLKPAQKKIREIFSKKFTSKTLKKENEFYYNLGYSVTCNQDDVIYFLLKNNISFEGSCHYGDYNVVFKKNQKYFLILQNYGIQCRLADNYDEMLKRTGWVQEKPVQKINVAKWMKNEGKFYKT